MLKQRIQILLENNVIDDTVATFTKQITDHLLQNYEINEEATGFITHLAMATQRIINDQVVEAMDDAIYEEVRKSAGYDKAQRVMSYIEQQQVVSYPESEMQYLMLHLSNMFQERRNENA